MEENGRNFLSQNIHDSMFDVVRAHGCQVSIDAVENVRELRGLKNLFSSINNKALIGTLRKHGVTGERVNEFQLTPGDCVYVIEVKGLNKPVREYAQFNMLPPTNVLVITKYYVHK